MLRWCAADEVKRKDSDGRKGQQHADQGKLERKAEAPGRFECGQAVAEMGDRTQLLSLCLAARYRRPWPILAGVLVATLANHAVAGVIGVWFGRFLSARVLDIVVGLGLVVLLAVRIACERVLASFRALVPPPAPAPVPPVQYAPPPPPGR